METAATITELRLRVTRAEVLRNLGYPRARAPSQRVARQLDQRWDAACALLRPRGVYRLITGEQATALAMPRPTAQVGLGLCTIGPALEQAEQRLTAQDRMLEALLLDAFGSAAAEAAADALNAVLCAWAQERGLHLRPRFSPGYGSWDVRHQGALLALLPARELGVTLTEGMMMVPRKSVSFAVRLAADDEPGRPDRRHCAGCDLDGCLYRSEEADDETQAGAT